MVGAAFVLRKSLVRLSRHRSRPRGPLPSSSSSRLPELALPKRRLQGRTRKHWRPTGELQCSLVTIGQRLHSGGAYDPQIPPTKIIGNRPPGPELLWIPHPGSKQKRPLELVYMVVRSRVFVCSTDDLPGGICGVRAGPTDASDAGM